MGLLVEVERDGRARYRLVQENVETLRFIIYQGLPAHDDSFFEETWREGDLMEVLYKDRRQL